MLRVGLTGGIGAGKSTVADALARRGARVVDADRIAREVVEPGTPGLAAVAARFGPSVLRGDGSLDRAALAAVVFADPAARADLEAITHPLIFGRSDDLLAQAAEAGVAVHDNPLLVERGMAGRYHLVVVVDAPEPVRLARLRARGMADADARARMAAQAGPAARRAAADGWLDNSGDPGVLAAEVDRLWDDRIAPFEANLRTGGRVRRSGRVELVTDPDWPAQAARLLARIRQALGPAAVTGHHIGSTAVPRFPAKDVLDLQVGVSSLAAADDPGFVEALARAGFPRVPGVQADTAHPVGEAAAVWPKRFHGGCDPGRVVHVHVRQVGSPGWRWALLFRDWLRAEPAARTHYLAQKRRVAAATAGTDEYAEAKEPWFETVHAQVEQWARSSGWQPPDR